MTKQEIALELTKAVIEKSHSIRDEKDSKKSAPIDQIAQVTVDAYNLILDNMKE